MTPVSPLAPPLSAERNEMTLRLRKSRRILNWIAVSSAAPIPVFLLGVVCIYRSPGAGFNVAYFGYAMGGSQIFLPMLWVAFYVRYLALARQLQKLKATQALLLAEQARGI